MSKSNYGTKRTGETRPAAKPCDFSKQDWYKELSPEARAFLDATPEEITLSEDETEVVFLDRARERSSAR